MIDDNHLITGEHFRFRYVSLVQSVIFPTEAYGKTYELGLSSPMILAAQETSPAQLLYLRAENIWGICELPLFIVNLKLLDMASDYPLYIFFGNLYGDDLKFSSTLKPVKKKAFMKKVTS